MLSYSADHPMNETPSIYKLATSNTPLNIDLSVLVIGFPLFVVE